MIKMKYLLLFILTLTTFSKFAQNYERYKKLDDNVIRSTHLNFDKNISVLVPKEWQKETTNKFPLIVVFDRQNKRSNDYILHTIDYLTSNVQIPSAIIISVESEQRYRYIETQYKTSDPFGIALENEKFLFEELIPLAEKEYHANAFRLFIGHSRYGYFTTSLFCSRTNDLNAVISMSPFFVQDNVNLTDSIIKLNQLTFRCKKYYRFGIGNDYPEDFSKMASVTKNMHNPLLDIK